MIYKELTHGTQRTCLRRHRRGCPRWVLEEVISVRKTLDSRYDDLKTGRVKPIDGEEAFVKLREKSERRRSGG